ncbi:hypothetical protein M2168_006286 [Streptomyces sp. CZ24]|nr:hypothetical protein [Streptomyces sp. CZ24]
MDHNMITQNNQADEALRRAREADQRRAAQGGNGGGRR